MIGFYYAKNYNWNRPQRVNFSLSLAQCQTVGGRRDQLQYSLIASGGVSEQGGTALLFWNLPANTHTAHIHLDRWTLANLIDADAQMAIPSPQKSAAKSTFFFFFCWSTAISIKRGDAVFDSWLEARRGVAARRWWINDVCSQGEHTQIPFQICLHRSSAPPPPPYVDWFESLSSCYW